MELECEKYTAPTNIDVTLKKGRDEDYKFRGVMFRLKAEVGHLADH